MHRRNIRAQKSSVIAPLICNNTLITKHLPPPDKTKKVVRYLDVF